MVRGRRGAVLVIFILSLAAMAAGPGFGVAQPSPGQRVQVAAFRNSRLFTCCPPDGRKLRGADFRLPTVFQFSDGLVLALPLGVVASPMSPLAELFQFTRPILDRLSPPQLDEALKQRIEAAFEKDPKLTIVASPGGSDTVFLAEGLYIQDRAEVRAAPLATTTLLTQGTQPDFLAACMAIAVPAEIYEHGPTDGAALLAARKWEGSDFFRRASGALVAASPEELVKQYLRGKIRSDSDPLRVCAVPPLRQLSNSASQIPGPAPPEWKKTEAVPHEQAPVMPLRPSDPAAIRVNVSLVSVPVIASDARGRFLPDLKESNFRLFEDGVEQQIDRFLPAAEQFHVVLLMDTSRSTRFKHSEIQQAALAFVRTLRPGDRLMVVSFDSRIYLDSEFTGDARRLRDAVMQTRMGTNTRLHDAVQLVVADHLSRIPGRKAIVLFTDGVDNASRLSGAAETLSTVQESDVMVYAVQYDTGGDLPVAGSPPGSEPGSAGRSLYPKAVYARAARYLQDLAEASGGRCFPAETLDKIRDAFARIADELRQQYTLYYYPARPAGDGSFRSIRVMVDIPGTKIRARKGYRLGGAPAR